MTPTNNSKRQAIVFVSLIAFPPLGVMLMWLWMEHWKVWVKAIVTLLLFVIVVYILFINFMVKNYDFG